MSDQGQLHEIERAGVWRRLAAILIDMLLVAVLLQAVALVLFPLTHGRVQFADGIYAIDCSKRDALPAGVVIPADFNANAIIDCQHRVFGLVSARTLRVARITRDGAITKEIHFDSMLDADGVPIAGLSLGILLLPLLLAWRFVADGRGRTPGRRICRIRLLRANDHGPPSASALRQRYLFLLAILSPLLIWPVILSFFPVTGFPENLLLEITLASYCPALVVILVGLWQVYRRTDTWYDRFAGTSVLRVGDVAAMSPVAAAGLASSAAGATAVISGFESADMAHEARSLPLPPSTELVSPRGRQNYVARHWRGALSLPLSYWVNGALMGFLAWVTVSVMRATLLSGEFDDRPVIEFIAICSIWLGVALLMLWQDVGIWRAATAYRVSGHRIWGGIVKTTVLLGIAGALWQLFNTGLPQIADVAEIVAGDPRLGPHQFRALASGDMLEFSGGITFGVARELDGLLGAMPNVKTVRLNSQGGRLREAQRMSDIIKARGISTLVEKDCLSACTIVFLGGIDRAIRSNARLGFHQPFYRGIAAADRGTAIAIEEQRLQKFGLSRAFAERANKAEPTSMWFPDTSELVNEHVVTRVIRAEAIAPASPTPGPSSGKVFTDAAPPGKEEQVQDVSPPSAPRPPAVSIPPDLMKRLKSSQPVTRPASSITGVK